MRKFLPVFIVAGLFFSCQREEADAPFATDTDISVLPNTETKASNDGLLGWGALTGQTHISAEEAQETALATAIQMREVEGIVTKAPLKIGSIEVVKGDTRKPYVPTKGNAKPEQADVYIVNFANNQGYVITSADRRVPSVLAYNSYGHLGDTISNPGQAILFSYMQEYIEEQRADFEANKEKLATEAKETIFKNLPKERQEELIAQGLFDKEGKWIRTKKKPNELMSICDLAKQHRENEERGIKNDCEVCEMGIRSEVGEWKTNHLILPLIKTLWYQSGEYNNKVYKYCGDKRDEALIGCVAIAVGQLMGYYKRPPFFKGREMHWDDMTKVDIGDMFSSINNYSVGNNSTAKEDIQYLLAHLGDSDYLNMDYGCRESGSTIYRAIQTLTKLGYIVTERGYDQNTVINQIINRNPVYIRGRSEKKEHRLLGINFYNTYDGGHAWIIDGYVRKERYTRHYSDCPPNEGQYVGSSYETFSLVHHNFGWGGMLDGSSYKPDSTYYDGTGWYRIDVFNGKSGKVTDSNTYKSGKPGNYQYDLKILYVIK